MRARVGWTSSAALLGTGLAGIAAPAQLRSGPLTMLGLFLLICGACGLLVTGSPTLRGRPAGQHRGVYHRETGSGPYRPGQLHASPRRLGPLRPDLPGAHQVDRDLPGAHRPGAHEPGTGQPGPHEPGTDQPGTHQSWFGRQWLRLPGRSSYRHPYQEANAGRLPHGRHRRSRPAS